MTLTGWLFLVVSWSAILGLAVFCLRRTFRRNT